MAFALNKDEFRPGMIQQDSDQLPTGISSASGYANPDFIHFVVLLVSLILWKIAVWLPKIFANPFTSPPVQPLFISPYAPNRLLIRSCTLSMPVTVNL